VLDLRRNGGGSLEEAIKLTGLFIPRGPVVQTRGPDGDVDVGCDPDPGVLYDGPMIVLTSRFSASASEILAGALQDYGRALIVGDSSTFGKGTVQSMVSLAALFDRYGLRHEENPGAVKFTIRKFYRPSGASTQLRGVTPDLILPSQTDLKVIGEVKMSDPLPWDRVPPARFAKLDRVRPVLATLQRESAARVAADMAFRELGQSLAIANEKMETKSVSLNEAERRREKKQADDLEAALNQALAAQDANMPPAHEITLQNVDAPGLPPAKPPAPTATANSQEPAITKGDGDAGSVLVLKETMNILADYVHAGQLPLVAAGS
jgi:carboxyl-terminal processing protease